MESRIAEVSLGDFKAETELRNNTYRDELAAEFISKAKSILMTVPFSYSESISQEVAEGIVRHGDKLFKNVYNNYRKPDTLQFNE